MFLFRLYGCSLQREVFLAVCQVFRAKVVGATSSEGFLVYLCCRLAVILSPKGDDLAGRVAQEAAGLDGSTEAWQRIERSDPIGRND